MGQKTHPLGFRLGVTQSHRASWFAHFNQYPKLLREDYIIRHHIWKTLYKAGISKIQINRKSNQIELELQIARPGVIVGRSGTGIENIRANLTKLLTSEKQIRINIVEITKPDQEASLLADFVVQQLEKRVAFRRAIRQVVQRSQRSNVEGIKIQVAGRLNGSEIARTEWVREGKVPLQTLRADIDYAYRYASTTYGVLGVKVWIFKGELFPKRES
uniref:Small ribosomal subunit protein uS3c n=1 Tax=Sciadococcus taiwanensis TaxID=3028030 RepID=A0A9Y1I2B3_9RHOD|nr:ribosomal protein S3 [Sciadococcus taiwanensis]